MVSMVITYPTPRNIGRSITHTIRATISPIIQPATFANPLIMRYWWEVWWVLPRPEFLICWFVAVISVVAPSLTMRPMTVWHVWVARRKKDEWTQRTEVQAVRQQILPRRVWRFLTGWMNLRWPFVPTGEQLILLPIRQSDALIEMANPIYPDSENRHCGVWRRISRQSPWNPMIKENPKIKR